LVIFCEPKRHIIQLSELYTSLNSKNIPIIYFSIDKLEVEHFDIKDKEKDDRINIEMSLFEDEMNNHLAQKYPDKHIAFKICVQERQEGKARKAYIIDIIMKPF
jgi:alkyl hydroperoxide reductase subunit AhpC